MPALLSTYAEGRDNHFNLIRMIAATGVLVSHSWPISVGAGTVEPLQALLGYKLGTLCVFIFFAISGFYIVRSFDRRRDWASFLEARLVRLFPALLVMLALTVLVGAVLSPLAAPQYWPEGARYFINNALLKFTQYEFAMVYDDRVLTGVVNGSLWSLWYEFFCYLTVLFLGVLGVFSSEGRARKAAVLMVALCLFLHVWHQIAPGKGWPYGDETYAHVGLPFAFGAALYAWRRLIVLSPLVLLGLALLTWLASSSLMYLPALQLTLAYGCLLLGFARAPKLLMYNKLGDYSYGIYIYAFPVQQLVAPLSGPDNPLMMIAIALPISLVLAILSWHLIEAPSQKLRGRFRARVTSAKY